MIAACTLQPGTYLAVNSGAGMVGGNPAAAVATISNWGFPITADQMAMLAHNVGEKTLFFRTGGAPAFALGMAKIFSDSLGGTAVMAIWYHFAIMFEALFILTVLDAGTRVARFMLQDALGHIWKPLGRTSWYPSIVATSALMVAAWGYFLWQGIRDPLGGINSLWPLFGICNQLLAAVALCVATTIIVKMGRARYIWVTLAPLCWLVAVTFAASWHKVFDPNPLIGLLAHARQLAAGPAVEGLQRRIFNDQLDAAVCGLLVVLVSVIVIESATAVDQRDLRTQAGGNAGSAVRGDSLRGGGAMKSSGDREKKSHRGDAEARRKPKNLPRRHGDTEEDREIGNRHMGVIGKSSSPEILNRVLRTIRAALREIFDESAYDRFLLRTHALRSIASYREFTRERDAAMVKKPRCC